MRADGGRRGVFYAYIDDYGVYVLEKLGFLELARRLRKLMKENLRKAGLGSHKETEGGPGEAHVSVGVSVGGSPPEVSPNVFRLWVAILGTIE